MSEKVKKANKVMLDPELEQYRKYLDKMDMTDEEKDEAIQTTRMLLNRLVDDAWGFIRPIAAKTPKKKTSCKRFSKTKK